MSVLEHFDPVVNNLGLFVFSSWFLFWVSCFFFYGIFLRFIFFKLSVLGDGSFSFFEFIVNFVGGVTGKLTVGFLNNKNKRILNLFIFVVFGEILFLNIIAMIPGGLSITSFWAVAFFFAAVIWIYAGLLRVYFKRTGFITLFVPEIKAVILFILIIIEFVSYILRLVSLHVRLMANILAGHALLNVLCAVFYASIGLYLQTILIVVTVLIMILEFIVAAIQAYIFLMLMVLYLSDFLSN